MGKSQENMDVWWNIRSTRRSHGQSSINQRRDETKKSNNERKGPIRERKIPTE